MKKKLKDERPVRVVRVSGTQDKVRVGFFQCGPLSEKLQEQIKAIIREKWDRFVTVIRWPRSHVVELKLHPKMIHAAGFLEIEQEFAQLWTKFLAIVRQMSELGQIARKGRHA